MSEKPSVLVTENKAGAPMLEVSFPGQGQIELLLSQDQLWDLAAGSLDAMPMESQAEMAKEQTAIVWRHVRDDDAE